MFTNEVSASTDASNIDGRLPSSCADSAINAPSRVEFTDGDSNSGVSTNSVMSPTRSWYILRTTYGQEQKAYDYIVDHGGTAYYPKISTFKTIKGVEKVVESSRIPNIFLHTVRLTRLRISSTITCTCHSCASTISITMKVES